jgi:hypothetical protein
MTTSNLHHVQRCPSLPSAPLHEESELMRRSGNSIAKAVLARPTLRWDAGIKTTTPMVATVEGLILKPVWSMTRPMTTPVDPKENLPKSSTRKISFFYYYEYLTFL